MANKTIRTFEKGQTVKFYVRRFRKWYEGIVLGKDESLTKETGNPCYEVRVTKAQPNPWGINEVGNLWAVEGTLIEAM